MDTKAAIRIHRQWVNRGLGVGLVLLATGWLLIEEIPLPRAVRLWLIQNDLLLPGLLAWPTLVFVVAAAVAMVWGRDAASWIAMAVGAAAAAVALVVTVIAAMGLIALVVM